MAKDQGQRTEEPSWHDAAEAFLHELLEAQRQLDADLGRGRLRVVSDDGQVSPAAAIRSESVERLYRCYQRRAELLQAASFQGLPASSLGATVAAMIEGPAKQQLQQLIAEAASTARRLQLAGVTHWMLAKRSLMHVSQLLEILATGSPQPPTYGNGAVSTSRGGLLDEAA